jgi:hypothetical protein
VIKKQEGIAMAANATQKKGMELYKKNAEFNRKSNSHEAVTLGVPQGHKPNSPFVKAWKRAQQLGYNADMVFAQGLVAIGDMGENGAIQMKQLVPRKNAKAIPKPKPKKKATNSKAKKSPAKKKTNSKK